MATAALVGNLSVDEWEQSVPSRQLFQQSQSGFEVITGSIQAQSTMERQLPRLIGRIVSLFELEDGWDSYGAKPIREEAVAGALALLLQLCSEHDAVPTIVPMPTGGVALEWHQGAMDLEIEIEGVDRGSFLWADDVTGDECEGDLPGDRTQLESLLGRFDGVR